MFLFIDRRFAFKSIRLFPTVVILLVVGFSEAISTGSQGCQFSDFSLISDLLRIKESGIKLIKSSENMDTISIVFKDRLGSGKGLDNF